MFLIDGRPLVIPGFPVSGDVKYAGTKLPMGATINNDNQIIAADGTVIGPPNFR